MELRAAFALTLRELRLQQGLTQEDFTTVSSRTNLSLLEREKTVPTIEKLAQLCTVLKIHPLTLMAICYSKMEGVSIDQIFSHSIQEATLLSSGTTGS